MFVDAILDFIRKLFEYDMATHIFRIELFVVTATLLLVVRFLIDFYGPWYSNVFMVLTVRTMEAVNHGMVQYTLVLMQLSGTIVNEYFQVWAVLLVTLQYSVKIGHPYSRYQRIPLLDLMSSLWGANILWLQTSPDLKIPLWLIWCLNAGRIITYFWSSSKVFLRDEDNTKLISDYMSYEHTLSDSVDPAPSRMSGYKYLVLGDELQKMKAEPPKFRVELDLKHKKLVTVERIWQHDKSGLLGCDADPDNQLKDVCLSFALYKLLRRRYYDLPIHEARHDKTRRLVLDGILQQGDERVFRITQVQLLFLQDQFYSKHAALFSKGFPVGSLVLSLSLIASCLYMVYPVGYIPERIDRADPNRVTHGVLVSRCIIDLIVGKELCEIFMYVFSQWTKVLMICWYVTERRRQPPVVERMMRFMFWLISCRGKWKEEIGQYNILIVASCRNSWIKGVRANLCMNNLFPPRIKLPTQAKKAIIDLFRGMPDERGLKCYLSNALGSNVRQFSWAADELEADTHRILVWHVATCLCEIHLSTEVAGWPLIASKMRARPFVNASNVPADTWGHYMTAVSLSNYCAYLLLRALVPDNGLVVDRVLAAVATEVRLATRQCRGLEDIHVALLRTAERLQDSSDKKMIEMGAQLARQLLQAYGGDVNSTNLWRDLGKFWAGFLLHLAASTKAAKHKTHLASSGELITHLWTLLSNAGFVGGTRHGEQQLDPVDRILDPLNRPEEIYM